MKLSYPILFILSFIIISGCSEHDTVLTPEQVFGSGLIITENPNLPLFNSVIMTTAGKVNIEYGSIQKLSASADDNLLKYITTDVSDGILNIGITPNISLSNLTLVIDITMTDLRELSTISAGSIEGKNTFTADDVHLNIGSAGNICVDLEVDTLFSDISSAGNLYLTGSTDYQHATLSSAGNLFAYGLITQTTDITVNSVGNAEVSAIQYLFARLNSIGSVFFKGNPIIDHVVTSIGRVVDAN